MRVHDETLAPFVPLIAAELGADGPTPVYRSIDGTLLSADISGFTALTERLAADGRIGSERLTALVNGGFEAMIDAAYAHGAEVLKFGGDALLVLFRGDDHERRAAASAFGMHDALHRSAAASESDLTMTVGVGSGPFDVFLVGSATHELLITGPAAATVLAAEAAAAPGETVATPAIASACAVLTGVERAPGVVLLEAPAVTPVGPADRGMLPSDLRDHVPTSVSSQLAAVRHTGGEHRLGSVVFVAVDGVVEALADDASPVAAALHAVVDAIHARASEAGVAILHSDIAPAGAKFLLCAGAPASSGFDEDAALTAATAIARIPTALAIRCGAARGRLFATFLGTAYRRTYTLMGDPVNTAARMLGPAGTGEVVATDDLVRSTRTTFVTEDLGGVVVKGKRDPIPHHRVIEPTHDVRRSGLGAPVVGRDEEIQLLRDVVERPGGIVQVVAPAGAGTSRLLVEVHNHAFVRGITVFAGSGAPLGGSVPYGVVRPMLRRGLGIDVDADPVVAGDLLGKILAEEAPELEGRAPLLAVVVGAEVPSTPESDAIDDEFRTERIHDAVVDLLDGVMLDDPVLFVVEDRHWIDEASAALVDRLRSASLDDRPWATCVTTRPGGELDEGTGITTIRLGPLGDEAIRAIAIGASTRPLTDTDLDRIVARSQGRALFAKELARLAGDDLPETVEQVIVDRIDRLDPDVRAAVRTVSVFGSEVRLSDLAAVVGDDGVPDDFVGRSRGLLVSPAPDVVVFEHALHRETAYDGLPYAERQRLHRRLGDHLEASTDDPRSVAAVLTRHYSAAGDDERTWRYGVLAAGAAAADAAWQDAAGLYRDALATGSGSDDERAEVFEALGECGLRSGDYAAAEAAFADAVERSGIGRTRAHRRIREAVAATRQGAYERATSLLETAAGDDLVGADRELVLAEVHAAQATVAYQRADNGAAVAAADRALALGGDALPVLVRARVAMVRHVASEALGHEDALGFGEQALAWFRDAGDPGGEAEVLNNLGVSAYYRSDRAEAEHHYRACVELKDRAGDVAGASVARMNLAELLIERGRAGEAGEMLDRCRRNFEATGFQIGVLYCRQLDAQHHLLDARPDEALDLLAATATAYRELGAEGRALETEIVAAEAHFLADDLERASVLVDQLWAAAEADPDQFDEGVHRARARLLLVRGAVAFRESGFEVARGIWADAATEADLTGADELRLIVEALTQPAARRRRRVLAQLEELGIEQVPILRSLGVTE